MEIYKSNEVILVSLGCRVITPRSMVGLYEKDNARNRTTLTKFTYSLNIGHHNIFKVSISAAQSFGDVKILQKDPVFSVSGVMAPF